MEICNNKIHVVRVDKIKYSVRIRDLESSLKSSNEVCYIKNDENSREAFAKDDFDFFAKPLQPLIDLLDAEENQAETKELRRAIDTIHGFYK